MRLNMDTSGAATSRIMTAARAFAGRRGMIAAVVPRAGLNFNR
jgi:hypothetical protein